MVDELIACKEKPGRSRASPQPSVLSIYAEAAWGLASRPFPAGRRTLALAVPGSLTQQ